MFLAPAATLLLLILSAVWAVVFVSISVLILPWR